MLLTSIVVGIFLIIGIVAMVVNARSGNKE
jgi:hypothetical protein